MTRRSIVWVSIGAITVIALLIAVWPWSRRGRETSSSDSTAILLLKQITVGSVKTPAEALSPRPLIRTKSDYETGELLALQLSLTATPAQPLNATVRLLTDQGALRPFEPHTLTLAQQVSVHCCWTIDQEGSYILQLFLPGQSVRAIPLEIKKNFSSR